MSCPTCKKVTCPAESSLPFYFGQYSLSNGTFYQNTSPISVPVTVAPGVIVLPPGAIQISVPTNPTSPFTFVSKYKGCTASYTIQIPPTQNAAFFDQVIAALSAQLGLCLSSTGSSLQTKLNQTQTLGCSGGAVMLVCNPSLVFPAGVSFDSSGSGALVMAAGIISGATVAKANAAAINYLTAFLNTQIGVGGIVCGGTCPTACGTALSSLNWTITNESSGSGTASGSASGANLSFECAAGSSVGEGEIQFTATITNTTDQDCVFQVALSVTPSFTSDNSAEGQVFFFDGSNASVYTFNTEVVFNNFPGTYTVPANSSVGWSLTVTAIQQTSSYPLPPSLTGTISISLT